MQYGRREIYTDVEEITSENIISVLKQAMIDFLPNAEDCDFLLKYEKGMQKKTRVKKYRVDIDQWCVDNIANEITEFKTSFNWGNPITLVQRGEKDGGTQKETSAIALLNECYEAEKIKQKTQDLARFVEICGIGFTIVDLKTEYEPGDSFFSVNVLDPRFSFIIKSNRYIDRRAMLGVTFRRDIKGNAFFTCFSKDTRYEILNLVKVINGKPKKDKEGKDVTTWEFAERSGEENPLNRIPIIEWIRSYDRMGCFERQISEMDNLNLLVSDFTNDVDQNTQAIWHGNDVDFPKDEQGNEQHPKTNDWMITQTTKDGKTPFVKPLAIDYDYAGMLNQMIYRVNRIKEKCNVPQRNDNSGGSTGIAMSDATGWTNAEIEASMQDQIKEGCKMEEVKVVLAAIQESPDVSPDSPLLSLKYSDITPSISRQKNYELTTKINFFATAVGHGIHGLHALRAMNAFPDVNQVWEDSKDLIEAYQKSIFEKSSQNQAEGGEGEEKPNSDRYEQDESDQIENSPMLDSNRTSTTE